VLTALIAVFLSLLSGETSSSVLPGSPLATLIERYLDASSPEEAEQVLKAILQDPEANLERVRAVLKAGGVYRIEPVGVQPDRPIRVGDRTYSFGLYVPESYQPTKAYALVVCLHGAGFTGDAYLERWRGRLGDDYILACPTLRQATWWTREAEELVLATIRVVRQRYRIDPDRIFLTGMSNGGIGVYLIGLHHAPLFAGLAPMAAGLDEVLFPLLENLKHTPVYIIHGSRDQVMPVDLSRKIVRAFQELGIRYVYREHDRFHPQAGGHFFPREELADLVAWIDATRRAPYPTHVVAVRDATHLLPFSWVRIDATDRIALLSDGLVERHDPLARRYARIEARVVAPNRIDVHTQWVRRYTLFLNDSLVDYRVPVTVLTNGQVSYEGLVTPSLETLLREARNRQDRHVLFPVKLTLAVDAVP
jgi:poly(3-hydroxybutyrate) depolymerase